MKIEGVHMPKLCYPAYSKAYLDRTGDLPEEPAGSVEGTGGGRDNEDGLGLVGISSLGCCCVCCVGGCDCGWVADDDGEG